MTNTATERLDRLTRTLLAASDEPNVADRVYELLGEFCHGLRNRLNAMKISLYLAQRSQADPAVIEPLTRHYRDMEQFVENLQGISGPVRLTRVLASLGSVLQERRAAWTEMLTDRGFTLDWVSPRQETPAMLDPAMLIHALDDLVAWRAAVGASGTTIRLAWRTDQGTARLSWEEESAGEPPEGRRNTPPGLALARLGRVATAHGGRLDLLEGETFRLALSLPLAAEPPAGKSPTKSSRSATLSPANPVGS